MKISEPVGKYIDFNSKYMNDHNNFKNNSRNSTESIYSNIPIDQCRDALQKIYKTQAIEQKFNFLSISDEYPKFTSPAPFVDKTQFLLEYTAQGTTAIPDYLRKQRGCQKKNNFVEIDIDNKHA